jgi:hypothetical protein
MSFPLSDINTHFISGLYLSSSERKIPTTRERKGQPVYDSCVPIDKAGGIAKKMRSERSGSQSGRLPVDDLETCLCEHLLESLCSEKLDVAIVLIFCA